MTTPRIVSVIVTYHPEAEVLSRLVAALAQAGAVVIVDNTDEAVAAFPVWAPAVVVHHGRNLGIATALNRGVAEARSLGAEVIALFDQDSVVDSEFMERLVSLLVPGQPGVVAAVALAAGDSREYPSHRVDALLGWRAVFAARAHGPVPADAVITSGSAATLSTYDSIGGYDNHLFIDGVDVEWCLRCRAAGVPVMIEPAARLLHRIGGGDVRIPGLGRTIVHSEHRAYFKVRNPWLIARRPHCPPALALRLICVALLRESLVAIRHPTGRRVRAVLSGLRDGVLGRGGPRRVW